MTTHFFALVNVNRTDSIRKLSVNQTLQQSLMELFQKQEIEFLPDGINEIPFDANYNVDESEIFKIDGFSLPQMFIDAVQTPRSIPQLSMTSSNPPRIKSIFSGSHDTSSDSFTLRFQAFNKARLLVKGFTILHQGDTFQRLTDPGLTLDTKLIAVFKYGSIYFRSFKAMNPIIDISQYFAEASDPQIIQVLDHSRLIVDDREAVLRMTDSWMRRRYSAVLASGVLDYVTPRKIATKAIRYGITLNTRRVNNADALVFPNSKKEVKTLLTFLNEGFYEGELTGALYQTNSQRSIPSTAANDAV